MRYHYRRADTNEIIEIVMMVAEMERRQRPDGSIILTKKEAGKRVKAFRDIASELVGFRNTPGNWPQVSDAAGVMPGQQKEAEAEANSRGVPTKFNSDGQAIFESRSHRARYLRAHGMHDKDAGYSDPSPR